MPTFCANCGRAIDEGSKFCQGCGATVFPAAQSSPPPPTPQPPQWSPPPAPSGAPMMGPGMSNKTKAVLLGGLVAGLLSGTPLIGAGNVCCCLWVIVGGALAVYLYGKDVPFLMSGDAALLGLQSGMVAAVVKTIIDIPIHFLMVRFAGTMQREFIEKMIEQNPDFPAPLAGLMRQLMSPGFAIGALLIGFIFSLVLFSIFGALGGLLGQAIFKKKSPHQPA